MANGSEPPEPSPKVPVIYAILPPAAPPAAPVYLLVGFRASIFLNCPPL